MAKALMADRTYWSKFMVLVSMILVFTVFMSLIGFLVGYFGFGIDIRQPNALSNIDDPNVVGLLKSIQILTQFGMFIIPSIIMAYLVSGSIGKWFTLDIYPGGVAVLTCVLIMLCSIPFVNWLVQLNAGMDLPAAFSGIESYMKQMEESAADLTRGTFFHLLHIG
ncbi:MAG: hypothetical protein HKN22_07650, partial [Bacteroidia bacterium]|nr:hypothetical protein [Bacteroidia bacterium]